MASLFQCTSHASLYSKFRLSPPKLLIDQIISYLKSGLKPPFRNAVDIGCGTGHSTVVIAPYFENVTGLDVSAAQIENAKQHRGTPNVIYRVSEANATGLPNAAAELVTVGQALHWFDHEEFYAEVKRILIPNGVIAVYGYWIPVPKVDDYSKTQDLSHLITKYWHDDILGKYWDPRRYEILQKHYETINLPFCDISRHNFVKQTSNSVANYIGYLSSWSSYQELLKQDPKQATELLQQVQERIMEILDVKTPPETTNLNIFTDFFLLLGRNSTTKNEAN